MTVASRRSTAWRERLDRRRRERPGLLAARDRRLAHEPCRVVGDAAPLGGTLQDAAEQDHRLPACLRSDPRRQRAPPGIARSARGRGRAASHRRCEARCACRRPTRRSGASSARGAPRASWPRSPRRTRRASLTRHRGTAARPSAGDAGPRRRTLRHHACGRVPSSGCAVPRASGRARRPPRCSGRPARRSRRAPFLSIGADATPRVRRQRRSCERRHEVRPGSRAPPPLRVDPR